MLHRYAAKVVDQLYCYCELPVNKRAIYVYGAELTLSCLISSCTILLLSLLFGNILSGIIFLILFISLRLFAGGYHAETYRNCFILTNCVFVLSYGVSMLIDLLRNNTLCFAILLISATTIFLLTPIRNHHHPLTETTYLKNKHISRVLIFMECGVILFIYLLTLRSHIFINRIDIRCSCCCNDDIAKTQRMERRRSP